MRNIINHICLYNRWGKIRAAFVLTGICCVVGCSENPVSIPVGNYPSNETPFRNRAVNGSQGNGDPVIAIDGSKAVIEPIAWPQGRPSGLILSVDWPSIIGGPVKGADVAITRISACVRLWEREGPYVPDVKIRITGVDNIGRTIVGEGRAEGPEFNGGMSWASSSPGVENSFGRAFVEAYRNALVSISNRERTTVSVRLATP